jgi:GntR family transcriptional repressor for pyruvate dehydrogenase complex
MEVTPVKRTLVSEQIFEQLKGNIITGELRPGDRLPSEQELCRMYGVSRTTVRQALANLSSLDLIEKRFGEGSFVKEVNNGAAMTPLLSHTFLNEKSIFEIVEFRRLMEANVTRLACEKADDADVRRLEQIYQQMVRSQDDLREFGRLDCAFHQEIAVISRNSYLAKIYEIISDVLLHAFSDIVSRRGNEAGLRYHKELVEAFEAKDAERAAAIMQAHMDELYQVYC